MSRAEAETAPAGLAGHRSTLEAARAAIRERSFFSGYPDGFGPYGEGGAAEGKAAFEATLRGDFSLDQPADGASPGGERSPFGFDLDVAYPHSSDDDLLAATVTALPAWRDAGPDARADVCLEILARLNRRSHEIAQAVMHTSGQAYVMAFQAGGPHAQDRALEAIAYAYEAMSSHASSVVWERPQGKRPPLRLRKRFRLAPRGTALVVGCQTFPTWNAYPGLFASLVTGNPVVIKPSPQAILPLALTARVAREVIAEAGFDPNLVVLAAETQDGGRRAAELALRPEIRIIDYTGSSGFGDWLERTASQAVVFTEKAGVNTVVIDSTDDYAGMLANLAFTLALYSGQMCTTPQNLALPRDGIDTDEGRKSFDQVGADLAGAIARLLGEPARATAILGAIANPGVLERLERAPSLGRTVLESRAVEHPEYPAATVRTPALIAVDDDADGPHLDEHFGPVAFLVAVDDTAAGLRLLVRTTATRGAITAGAYSRDETVLEAAERAALEAGVSLAVNFTGGVYVNQSAAFSDFHASAANPAANACLTDLAFVASRFHVVESRRPLEEPE